MSSIQNTIMHGVRTSLGRISTISSGTKKISAFILRAIEIASLARGRNQYCDGGWSDKHPTILSSVFIVAVVRNVDYQVWIYNARPNPFEHVQEEKSGGQRWIFERSRILPSCQARSTLLSSSVRPFQHVLVTDGTSAGRFGEGLESF